VNQPSAICHLPSAPRILIRGTNWLGDAVMTTPALLRLRENFPEAHITLLTQAKLADLWQQHPAINETIGFKAGESIFAIAKKLRAGKFDLALVLPNSPRSALEVFFCGRSATYRLRASVAEFFPDAIRRAARRRGENAQAC